MANKELKKGNIVYLKGTKSYGSEWDKNFKHEIGMECKIHDNGDLYLNNMQGEWIGCFRPEDVSLKPIEIEETYTYDEVMFIIESNYKDKSYTYHELMAKVFPKSLLDKTKNDLKQFRKKHWDSKLNRNEAYKKYIKLIKNR